MRHLMYALFLVLAPLSFAGDIVIEGERMHYLNPNWDVVGKDLIVKKGTPYLRVDTRGNCHYEYEQDCWTDQNGHVHCTTKPKWVCDYRAALFSLPNTLTTQGKEVRYVNGEKNIKVGVMKNFLWWKWVTLENYIGISTDIETAQLIIRDASVVLKEKQFHQLHSAK